MPPRFGVNYVPRTGWWYSWVDWDEPSIAADFAAISALGCDHVRIHCLWPLFQPNPTLVSPTMLGRLQAILDLADAASLDVIVTALDGWLSGFDFRPAWVPDRASIFADLHVIDAELDLLAAIATRVGGHSRFLGFDVSNEPSAITGRNPATREQGDRWVKLVLDQCETVAPGRFHTVGMDDGPWLRPDSPFGRNVLASTGTATPIHSWVYFTGALERYGERGTGTIHLAEYLLELAKAHGDPGRKVWLQEYGVSKTWLDRTAPADFLESATQAALSVDDLWGITWWCSHDIDSGLSGFAELEYDLGLFDTRNEIKPQGVRFREVIAAARDHPPAAAVRSTALVLADERTPDLAFADGFFDLIDQGVRPSIVLESRAADAAYLELRGIHELVRPTAS